ncbi:hypothetical protein HMJ29_01270 [Hymenobacter taeanensis]|uniref:STAS/SEC14 domain-containing protein n=1 Tax=Hymenobacter taeanensis TaxID=2735321 RepID=A0A6M6BBX3_9BACT|nr:MULTISPECIES: hypothetical protein [Hymenobacter]QJX45637.1 hypothetical protein HMJ29_01270 [Hymenobacter taeanensis]UOQ79473.1 hypothetical protein MUN83_11455 [Hymenobacter sp. 5414T-23]
MAQRALYTSATLSIAYHYLDNWLELQWQGSPNDEEVMEGALKLLELMHHERCQKILNDNSRMQGLWAEAARWGGEVFFPQLYAAGCRYFAWVQSPERYSQLSAELAIEHTTAGIVFMTFREPDTAAEWLRRM